MPYDNLKGNQKRWSGSRSSFDMLNPFKPQPQEFVEAGDALVVDHGDRDGLLRDGALVLGSTEPKLVLWRMQRPCQYS